MIWNVEGADADTGTERVVSVTADSPEEAERRAGDLGLLVSAVFPSTITEARRFEAGAAPLPVTPAATSPAALPTVPYRLPWTKTRKPQSTRQWPKLPPLPLPLPRVRPHGFALPPYVHLRVATWVIGALAALSYAAGLVAVFTGVFAFARSVTQYETFSDAAYNFLQLASPLILGALLHAAAAACDALRDLAISARGRASADDVSASLRDE